MPESEIHILSSLEKLNASPEEAAFGHKTQDQDIRNRINTLFAPQREEESHEAAQIREEDYETVNEGMTTDTTEAPSHAARRGGAEPEAAEVETKNADRAQAEEQQEGILSSDEEAVTEKKSTSGKIVNDKPLMSQGGAHEVRNFESEGASKSLFESDKAKEEVENRFSFGEQDLEYFGARL